MSKGGKRLHVNFGRMGTDPVVVQRAVDALKTELLKAEKVTEIALSSTNPDLALKVRKLWAGTPEDRRTAMLMARPIDHPLFDALDQEDRLQRQLEAR